MTKYRQRQVFKGPVRLHGGGTYQAAQNTVGRGAGTITAATARLSPNTGGTYTAPIVWGTVTPSFTAGTVGTYPLNLTGATSVAFAPGSATGSWLTIQNLGGGAFALRADGSQTTSNALVNVKLRASNAVTSADSAAFNVPVASLAMPFRNARTNVSYSTLQAAHDAAISGDTIKVAAGTYTPQFRLDAGDPYFDCTLPAFTVEWETTGSRPMFDLRAMDAFQFPLGDGGYGFVNLKDSCLNFTLRGIGVHGTPVSVNGGGAGVYIGSGYPNDTPYTVTVEYCNFEEMSHGLFCGPNWNGTVNVRYCVFRNCGTPNDLCHGLYVGLINTLNVHGVACYVDTTRNEALRGGAKGALLKSRAKFSNVTASVFIGSNTLNRCMEFPNGGTVVVKGCALYRPNDPAPDGSNQVIRWGDAQIYGHYTSDTDRDGWAAWNQAGRQHINFASNYCPDGRTHSLTMQQCTILNGASQSNSRPIQVDRIINNDPCVDLNGNPMVETFNVRGNLVAGFNAQDLINLGSVSTNNTIKLLTDFDITSGRLLSITPVPGSWLDATTEFAGDYTIPTPRSDTNRGAFQLGATPSWVPTTAWQWTDIPGTRLDTVLRDDGTGVDALGRTTGKVGASDGGDVPGFTTHSWVASAGFGGLGYSKKNKEFWLFGGGHNAHSNNSLTKIRIGKNTPDIVLASAATPYGGAGQIPSRYNDYTLSDAVTRAYHHDGKPKACHAYQAAQYIDAIDEFLMVTLPAGDRYDSGAGEDLAAWRVIAGFPRSAGLDQGGNGAWRGAGYWPDPPPESTDVFENMTALPDPDGTGVYFNRGNPGYLRRVNQNRTLSVLGSAPLDWGNQFTYATINAATRTLYFQNANAGHASTFYIVSVDLNTGTPSAPYTVVGTYPTGYTVAGLEWVPEIGKFVAVYKNGNNPWRVFLYTLSGTTITAVEQTIQTGSGAPTDNNVYRRMYYDADYGCLFFFNNITSAIKAVKVA